MTLTIRPAAEAEFTTVRAFYHTLIDEMRTAQYRPGWKKGIYPSDDYLLQSIRRQELYLGFCGGALAASMIVNHESNEGYRGVHWNTDVAAEDVTLIHALGVTPAFSGRGFAKRMVQEVIALARQRGQKVIRLDVLSGNRTAERLYAGLGFCHIDTVQMFYEDTGWTDFLLYEYPL